MPVEQTDMTSVIETAMADAGIDDASTAETPETPAAEIPAAPDAAATAQPTAGDATPPPAAVPSEEDELKALEAELTTATPGLAKGRISVSRHQAVLTRQRRQTEKALADAKAEAEKYAEYGTPDFQERLAAIRLAETNEDAFLNQVLLQHPKYKALIDTLVETRSKAARPAEPAAIAAPAEMPKPDYLHPDGSVGYTAETAQKLVEWQAAQLRTEHEANLKKLREELSPILSEHQNREALGASMRSKEVEVNDARVRWAGFTEFEKDILAELSKPGNETMNLVQAYDAVVPAKMKAREAQAQVTAQQQEAALRAKIVKEINDKSSIRTGVVPGGTPAATVVSDAPRDTEDIIRESMRKAGIAAA